MAQRLPILIFAIIMAVIPFVPGMPPFWIVPKNVLLPVSVTESVTGFEPVFWITAEPPAPRATVVGDKLRGACGVLRRFLDRNQITYTWIAPDDADAEAKWGGPLPPRDDHPTLRIAASGKIVSGPPLRRVAELIELQTQAEHAVYDTVIVGGGRSMHTLRPSRMNRRVCEELAVISARSDIAVNYRGKWSSSTGRRAAARGSPVAPRRCRRR